MAGPVRTAGPGPARIVAGAGATEVDAVHVAGAGVALAATGADGSDTQQVLAAWNGRDVSVLFPGCPR